MKCQKNVKKAHLTFPEPNVMSSYCFFCPNNSPKYKDSSFIIIIDKEKQQILTIKILNQQLFLLFYLKIETINQLSKKLVINFQLFY